MAAQRTVEIDGVKKQTSALQDLRDSITDCSDGMRSMQDEQLNTLQGSITILNSAWEGLMLTFSESNGVIKTVVDSLTDLLSAWTTWRKRNQGGDTAIQTYELGGDADKAQSYIEKQREAGVKDEGIKAQAEADKEALTAEIEELKKLEALYGEYDKWVSKADWHNPTHLKKNDEYLATFKAAGYGGGKESRTQLQKDIAAKIDQTSTLDLVIGQVTPAQIKDITASGDKDQEDKTKSFLAKRKAQIEAGMQEEIAAIDKANMIKEGKEAEYEEKVFQIKLAALEQIAKLYQEDTTERARADAAVSALKIQYQGTQMRLANKGSKSTKTYETQTGPSGYSQEGISALRSEIQGGMKSMQMGSSEYMVEANRLVDLASFENLLKAAVQAGVEIDPNLLETNFEKIDLGVDVTPEEWQTLTDTINAQLKELGLDPIELDVQTGGVSAAKEGAKATADAWQNAVAAVNNVGSALQQIEDPAAKVAGIVMQAVANIALGFAQAVASPATGAAGVFGWIAAATAGLATMVSTIAAVKSATSGSYASGGIIPGNSYSGDNLTANVNSGELILNRAQQESVASQLQNNNPMQNLQLSTEVSGTNLRIVLNNDNRSKGGSRGYYANIH